MSAGAIGGLIGAVGSTIGMLGCHYFKITKWWKVLLLSIGLGVGLAMLLAVTGQTEKWIK